MRMLGAIVRATLAGAAVALAVPAIVFSIALLRSFSEPDTIRLTLAIGLFVLAVMLILICSSVVLLGIPISILLRRAGRENRSPYALSGALSGFAVTFVWWLIGSRYNAHDISLDFALIAMMGAFGAASGAVTGVVLGRSLRS